MISFKKYRFILSSFVVTGLLFTVVLYTGCTSKKDKKSGTYTQGKTTILADEAYKPILEDQIFLYQIRYPETEFNMVYTGEDSAYESLIKDSTSMAVISFEPDAKHTAYFKEKGFPLIVRPIAYDGIVLAVNKNCPLDSFSKKQLHQLLTGQISTWEQLLGNTPVKGPVVLGFNRKGSGIINYFKKNYNITQFSPNSGTFKNTTALLDSVKQHSNLIGFIPYNYISDKDDSLTRYIKHNFKIISLQSNRDSSHFVLPSQSTLADSAYPLRRRILVINHEGKSGLGTGFVIFMASHQGQRAMLKAGLVPVNMPGRLIRVIRKNI